MGTLSLARGAQRGGFEIVETVAERAAVIVYRAVPVDGGTPVLLSEYLPARLAERDAAGALVPRSAAQADACRKGLVAFVDEAHALQRCDHPALLKVLQVWEEHGSAFCVTALPEGRPLSELRAERDEAFDETTLRRLLDGLLGALETWHREAGLHGAVTAANVLMLADGRPLLLGPGHAEHEVAGDRIAALLASDEPSFAPIEQIVPTADLPLGPSADLYALAGVLRFGITGQLPPPALERPGAAQREPLHEAVQRLQRHRQPPPVYSEALLATLDAALSPQPSERPQNVAQFRDRLGPAPVAVDSPPLSPTPPTAPPVPAALADLSDIAPVAPAAASLHRRRPVLLWGGAAIAAVTVLAVLLFVVLNRPPAPRSAGSPGGEATPARAAGIIDAPVVAAPVVVPPAPASAPAPPPSARATRPGRVATSPRETCSGRSEFALYRCMKTRCAQAQWKTHAQCEQLRRTDRVD